MPPSNAHLKLRRIGVTIAALGALAVFAAPAGAVPRIVPASVPGNVVCTTDQDLVTPGVQLALTADDGRIQTPDGNSLYMWGYVPAGGGFQIPGPVLCVTQGDLVEITLTNNLPAINTGPEPGTDQGPSNTSLVFPGQSDVVATGGAVDGPLAREAAPGGTVSYSFIAGRPGTYLYESGTEPSRQIEMGLYGAIIVRPLLGANYAYNDPSTVFDPEQEYILILHDIDSDLHHAVDRGQPFDITVKRDRYWTVNGRSFPDTIADSGVPWLPNQPYGSLVWVERRDAADTSPPALIRYANAGLSNHPFHPHGNHSRVIARDGALLKGPLGQDGSMEAFTKTIGSGQTYEILFRFDDDEGYSSANPVQFQGQDVVFPGLLNLVFKDDLTFYGGSPYLGETDELPPRVTTLNECGEFYFPWHSHALNEFQNFDEGFGGLATLLRIDPPAGCPPPPEPPFNTALPVISGIPMEGQTLTATDGTWGGTPPLTFIRQWQRLVGSVWMNIPGANASTYTLTGADVGSQIRIRVTAVNDVGSATAFSLPTDVVQAALRLSFREPGSIGGVGFANEDIVSYNGTSFAMLFDGSDELGLLALVLNLDAFAFLDQDSILLSFDNDVGLGLFPDVGNVDDSDVVRFDATSLGPTTAGTFSMFFDGSDVSLTAGDEDVDAIQQLANGNLVLSTTGTPTVTGVAGAQDEDLLTFTPTSLGGTTAGTYALRFDGSDVGLGTNDGEDVDSAWTAANGDIYLSTLEGFSVPGVSGADEDVFVFTPTSLGGTTTGTFSSTLQFDGSTFGQGGNDVDGAGRRLDVVSSAAAALAPRVAATAKVRGHAVTFRARTAKCAPCKATLRMNAAGSWRALRMTRVRANAYTVVAQNVPSGSGSYYAVIRDVDSGRRATSKMRQLRVGAPQSVSAAAAVSFDLCADEGSTTLPDSTVVPVWGFALNPGGVCGTVDRPGGPTLTVDAGDVVTINLTNNLASENVSLVFPGHTLAPDLDGVPPGGTASYTFTASNPGAYLYESGVNTSTQHLMGLFGALVVRPALLPGQAYADPTTAFEVEQVMVLSELDPDFNNGLVAAGDYDPEYWLINGQAYPAVPSISALPGQRVLLRYLNAGQEHHTMSLLGLRQRIIARDSFQPVVTPDVMAETIAAGSTGDAIATVPVTAATGASFPLYSRQLAVTNGPVWPGGMLTFITVP